MENIAKYKNCFGCGVCSVVCPSKVISMHLNEDGFYFPRVEETKCTECGLCIKVCAYSNSTICRSSSQPISFAAWSNDKNIRYNSTSGGIAFEIGRLLLAEGYYICGVRYNVKHCRAEHFIASTEEELKETVGSKYMPSYTIPGFSNIKQGNRYLVFGTPCQIDSMRRMIQIRHWEENFILVDFFCHSVPSMFLYRKYLSYAGVEYPDVVKFRDKREGWNNSYIVSLKKNGKEWISHFCNGDLFHKFFLGDRCPNFCCVDSCKYKQMNSAADIRIGDFWSRKYAYNKEGVSALIALSSKGKDVVAELKRTCTLEPCDQNDILEHQMKKNVVPSPSCSYVRKKLLTEMSLATITKVAYIIEFPRMCKTKINYYLSRIVKVSMF